ncbi:MAG: T6SS effector BTH_I2691 family protein [Pseudomonas sp.]
MSNPIVDLVHKLVVPSPGDGCPYCEKTGLLIFPLRHSAFCSDSPALNKLVSPVALGEKFQLEHAQLSARMLRLSYLYVLVKRPNYMIWQAYFVTDDARLYQFPIIYPPTRDTTFTCYRDMDAAATSVVSITKPEEVDSTYWLYSPDPITEARLDEYSANADAMVAAKKMQFFSPSQWVKGQRQQPFTLESSALSQLALEFKAMGIGPQSDSPVPTSPMGYSGFSYSLCVALQQQAFPPLSSWQTPDVSLLLGARKRLEALRDTLEKEQGAVFILRDAIGVTQELNAWRNAALEGSEPWLNEEVDRVSNHWRVQSALRLKDVQDGIREHYIQRADERIDAWAYDSHTEDNLIGALPDPVKTSRDSFIRRQSAERSIYLGDLEAILARAEVVKEAYERYPDPNVAAREALREDGKRLQRRAIGEEEIAKRKQQASERALKLFAHIDQAQVDATLDNYNSLIADCEAKAESRAQDHLALVTSPYLLNALYAYDPNNVSRGWGFAIQAALCTLGMETSVPGHAQFTLWWSDTAISEGNLFWRTYALNQQTLLDDTRAGLIEAKTLFEGVSVSGAIGIIGGEIKRAQSIIKAFDKANETLAGDENRSPIQWLARSQVGVLMGWYAQLAKGVFTYSAPNSVDRGLAYVLSTAVSWRLGRFAQPLQLHALAEATPQTLDRARAALQLRVRASVQAELEAGKVGNFYALRMGVIVGLYEAFQLYDKAQHMSDGNKQKAEFVAAALVTTAVSLELMHTGAEWTAKHYGAASATGVLAANWGAGLKLYGGFLGAAGGVIGAVLDGGTAFDEYGKNRRGLFLAYMGRSLSTSGVTILSLGLAVSGSGPYLRILMEKANNKLLQELLRYGQTLAAKLARQSALLFMRNLLTKLAWVTLGISAFIWMLDPKAIEKWCEKSVLRKNKAVIGYRSQVLELSELELAFTQTVNDNVFD